MLTMDKIHNIRELFYEQGLNVAEIARKTNYDRKTIVKYLDQIDFSPKPPKPESQKLFCPKLDDYKELIDSWLINDKKAPRKQRHTARRVFNRLRKEKENFCCSYRLVAQYVATRKKELLLNKQEGYIPLIHHEGEAQADFGDADFIENGILIKGKYLILSFPFSNAGYIQIIHSENMESLMEALIHIFEHIHCIPREIWFDNTSTVVKRFITRYQKELNDRFLRFSEHYGFKIITMNPASGNEKGNVERKVAYLRKNMLVPIPEFNSIEDFNNQLLAMCDADHNRLHYKFNETINSRFNHELKYFNPLPVANFDTATYEQYHTDKCGRIILDGLYTYSVSPAFSEAELWVKKTSEIIEILDLNLKHIISHKRLYGGYKQTSIEWLPYLSYISRKPRSLHNSGIYDMMPEKIQNFMDNCDTRKRGEVLRILCGLTEKYGFKSALNSVEEAIKLNISDSDSFKSLSRRLLSDMPLLPLLKLDSAIPNLIQNPAKLEEYDTFLKPGDITNDELQ